jgi:glycerol-3-phosphate acyltransferase PlsY
MDIELLIISCMCYLSGSIPFGIVISKFFNKTDPRKIGSKNIGATNVLRTSGWKLAGLTLIFDILKGLLPLKFVMFYNEDFIGPSMILIIKGHVFPCWLKFNGGKGVATFIGILLGYNFYFFLTFIFIWLCSALIFKFSSLAAILAILTNIIIVLNIDGNYLYFIIISIIVLSKHSTNFIRLLNGKESKIILKKKN